MMLDLKVTKEPEDVSSAKDGSRLLATVTIFGADHHLELIRVSVDDEGGQYADNEEYEDDYCGLQRLHEGKYQTFEVPGFEGAYIAYMVPYDD